MRLGQLARKYGVSKKEIISYLNQIDPSLRSLGNNTKLDQHTVMLIGQRFEHVDELMQEQEQSQEQQQHTEAEVEQQQQQEHTEPETASLSGRQPQELEPPLELETVEPEKEGESIETDKLLEMLESEENPIDLDKITLIKAPKKQLEGLKVLGKIDLPEPKPKAQKPDKDRKSTLSTRANGDQLSIQEREKRRLKAKKRKEAHQARQKKRQKARELEQKKAQNKARYQRKLERAKLNRVKSKPVMITEEVVENQIAPTAPKTLLGKLWKWLTTY